MTVTIELPPELEAGLVAQAKAQGLPLPQYVQHLLLHQFPSTESVRSSAERAAGWRQAVESLPHTPPLTDEAMSRERIYGDHD